MIRQALILLSVLFLSVSLGSAIYAQETENEALSFEFRGESLSAALEQIIRSTDIDLIYDPQLTEDIHVYERISAKNTSELLQRLLEDHQLDYITLSSGTYVIVKAVKKGPFYGTFAGKIVDSRTGEPLPGATVMLADASGGTNANQSGNFSINKLLIGTYQIIFSYVGYEAVSKTIEIKPNTEVTERIELTQKPVAVLPVVVEAHRKQIPYSNSLQMDSDTDLSTVGVMKDAIRNLSLMPGVQYGLPMTDLHLQGGQNSEHRILLDGVPVYNPYSFGQMFSSFSPYAIGNITLHKAGYGVKAGSQIAGLVNFSHDLPTTGQKSATLQGDPLSANMRGDLSFATGEKSSINMMTALRTNFWDKYRSPTLAQTLQDWDVIDPLITNAIADLNYDASIYSPIYHDSDLKFFDYHFAAGYDIDAFNSLSASFYLAENIVETRLINQADANSGALPYLYASDGYKWNNLTAQIRWDQMVTPRFDLSMQASYSTNDFEHQNKIGTSTYPRIASAFGQYNLNSVQEGFQHSKNLQLPTQIDGNRIQHFTIKTDGTYSISPHFSLQGGLQVDHILSSLDIAELTYFPANIDHVSTLFSSYINNRHMLGSYWNLEWGSRFTYTAPSGRFYAEPRFSVQYDNIESDSGYWSARISGGLYRQFINEYEVTNSGPTSLVPSFSIWSLSDTENIPKAWHLNGSTIFEPSKNTSLRMELFYKWQPVTNITSYGMLSRYYDITAYGGGLREIGAFAEATESKALGGGIQIHQSMAGSKLKLIAGYDYSYTSVDMETQFGRDMPAPWNEPHRVQFRMLWRLIRDLAVSAKWQGIWGRTWAFRQSYYNFLRFRSEENSLPYSFDTPENDKLSPFHQVDLSFIYQPSIGSTDLEIRLELLNLLNRKNTLEKYIQPVVMEGEDTSYQIQNRHLPGFYPSASIQVKF